MQRKKFRTFPSKIYFTTCIFDLCGITFMSLQELLWANWRLFFKAFSCFFYCTCNSIQKPGVACVMSNCYAMTLAERRGMLHGYVSQYVQICIVTMFDRHERSLVYFIHYLLFRFPYKSWCSESILDY